MGGTGWQCGTQRRRSRPSAWPRGLALAPAAAFVLAIALAACGGAGHAKASSTATAGAAAAHSQRRPVSSGGALARAAAIASVAGKPIARSSYEHWLSVERALGVSAAASERALGFLITSAWVQGEARSRGVSASAEQVAQRLAQLERQRFRSAGSLKAFLTSSHESEADLRARVAIELLQARIAGEVASGLSGSQRTNALASFQQAFQQRWRRRTTCAPAYVMEDCSEYAGPPATGGAPGHSASSSASVSSSGRASSGPSSSSSSSSSSASSGGEVTQGVGGMTIASSAFESNGAIPAQYTCDGADVSPPLQWRDVPAKAAALVLFVIDDTTTGSASGIRWVVGDISPTATGVAAGAIPKGGVVGADTQGSSGYGGICPAHGKTATIEFVLYALSKKIPLSPGFQ